MRFNACSLATPLNAIARQRPPPHKTLILVQSAVAAVVVVDFQPVVLFHIVATLLKVVRVLLQQLACDAHPSTSYIYRIHATAHQSQ